MFAATMRALGLLALAAGLWAFPAAAQQPNKCTPNGCGPGGWLGTVVPNRFFDCSFKPACDNHDVCYSRCESCGVLFGRPECQGTCEDKRERKERCDVAFRDQMFSDNKNKAHCKTAARAYYLAVRYRGCAYFRGLREVLRTREDFQRDFEAILKWLEENPDATTEIEVDLTLRRMSTLEASENNRLSTEGGRLKLVDEALAAQGSGRSAVDRPTERRLLNGIDVTDMRVDGKPFDLDRVRSERKTFDARGLRQQVIPLQ